MTNACWLTAYHIIQYTHTQQTWEVKRLYKLKICVFNISHLKKKCLRMWCHSMLTVRCCTLEWRVCGSPEVWLKWLFRSLKQRQQRKKRLSWKCQRYLISVQNFMFFSCAFVVLIFNCSFVFTFWKMGDFPINCIYSIILCFLFHFIFSGQQSVFFLKYSLAVRIQNQKLQSDF